MSSHQAYITLTATERLRLASAASVEPLATVAPLDRAHTAFADQVSIDKTLQGLVNTPSGKLLSPLEGLPPDATAGFSDVPADDSRVEIVDPRAPKAPSLLALLAKQAGKFLDDSLRNVQTAIIDPCQNWLHDTTEGFCGICDAWNQQVNGLIAGMGEAFLGAFDSLENAAESVAKTAKDLVNAGEEARKATFLLLQEMEEREFSAGNSLLDSRHSAAGILAERPGTSEFRTQPGETLSEQLGKALENFAANIRAAKEHEHKEEDEELEVEEKKEELDNELALDQLEGEPGLNDAILRELIPELETDGRRHYGEFRHGPVNREWIRALVLSLQGTGDQKKIA